MARPREDVQVGPEERCPFHFGRGRVGTPDTIIIMMLRLNDDEHVHAGDYHNDCNYDGDDDVNNHYDANVDDDVDYDYYEGL